MPGIVGDSGRRWPGPPRSGPAGGGDEPLRPLPPGVGQLGGLEQPGRGGVVVVVDPGHLAHGEAVAGTVDDLDRVAGGDLTLGPDAQVGAGPAGGRELAREPLAAHADAQLEAGDARLGDLEQGPADPPAPADLGPGDVDAADGQVLAEAARRDLPAQPAAPPLLVLGGIGVQRLVDPAMDLQVGLPVPVHVDPADPHPPRHRRLPDGGGHRPPPPRDLPGGADVHRLDHTRHADLPGSVPGPGYDAGPRLATPRPPEVSSRAWTAARSARQPMAANPAAARSRWPVWSKPSGERSTPASWRPSSRWARASSYGMARRSAAWTARAQERAACRRRPSSRYQPP